MAITNHIVNGAGSSTGSSTAEAKINAVNNLIDSIFANVNTMLSSHFTRVSVNDTKFNASTNYYYRESYKFTDNDNKYLVVELYIISSFIGRESLTLNFKIMDEIATTSSSSMSAISSISTSATANRTTSTVDNITTYAINISFNLIAFENENVYLLAGGNNKQNLYASLGIITINDKSYISFTSDTSTTSKKLTLYDSDGTIYYTSSIIIASHVGTDSTDYIMTLPIYLSSGTSATTLIYKDLKLENALQCPNTSCTYGGVYNIGGVDYFAIANNFLLKM